LGGKHVFSCIMYVTNLGLWCMLTGAGRIYMGVKVFLPEVPLLKFRCEEYEKAKANVKLH